MSRKNFPPSPDRNLFLMPPTALRSSRVDRTFALQLVLLLVLVCAVTTGALR
jgi:hypothetical protein